MELTRRRFIQATAAVTAAASIPLLAKRTIEIIFRWEYDSEAMCFGCVSRCPEYNLITRVDMDSVDSVDVSCLMRGGVEVRSFVTAIGPKNEAMLKEVEETLNQGILDKLHRRGIVGPRA